MSNQKPSTPAAANASPETEKRKRIRLKALKYLVAGIWNVVWPIGAVVLTIVAGCGAIYGLYLGAEFIGSIMGVHPAWIGGGVVASIILAAVVLVYFSGAMAIAAREEGLDDRGIEVLKKLRSTGFWYSDSALGAENDRDQEVLQDLQDRRLVWRDSNTDGTSFWKAKGLWE